MTDLAFPTTSDQQIGPAHESQWGMWRAGPESAQQVSSASISVSRHEAVITSLSLPSVRALQNAEGQEIILCEYDLSADPDFRPQKWYNIGLLSERPTVDPI